MADNRIPRVSLIKYVGRKEERLNRRVTAREIAKHVGIAESTLAKYWHGTIERPDLKTLGSIAKYLECEPGDLIVWANRDSEAK